MSNKKDKLRSDDELAEERAGTSTSTSVTSTLAPEPATTTSVAPAPATTQQWYDHQIIEPKWQANWEKANLFQQTEKRSTPKSKLDPAYLLFAFAYPSGAGLHVGHVESMTALDIMARFYRMQGKDVFFPVGWDAFGLPAENYAVKTGVHPAKTTKDAINTFRKQIKRLGISYDWANEIATSHPGYYKWTQWLFLEFYKKGLAYRDTAMVNWCPSCQTVLANEQVVNGRCERCDTEVVQKEMRQWFFRITDYKDELIEGLEQVDWPTATKQQQLNWIGRREGVVVSFPLVEVDKVIECFTTRLDTIFGATFLVISPEKFNDLELEATKEVSEYIKKASKKTEEERLIGEKSKTGIDTGLRVSNPVNGEVLSVFVADYVLGGYGTGAVMGVPAHDDRDGAFALQHHLPIVAVIEEERGAGDGEGSHNSERGSRRGGGRSGQKEAGESTGVGYTGYGRLINSGKYTGLDSASATQQLLHDFPDTTRKETNYRLRDWLISRQRYWGAPIPIVYDPEGNPHPVKAEYLPWLLPTDVEFRPTGESPLTTSKEFIERTEKLYGKGWRPEFDTMDTFVDSSWYYLRYVSARDEEAFGEKEQWDKWLPVDFYMIGPEHIVLHLLYSRFFTKFLRDEGYLNFDEPFQKMRHQGMILAPGGQKMSKSKGNVINPDDVVDKFGADTLRLYEMFMGPIEADKPWNTNAIAGVHKFVQRVYRLVMESASESAGESESVGERELGDASDLGGAQKSTSTQELESAVVKKLHQTIHKVTLDIPALKFNTAIASMMEFLNTWEDATRKGFRLSSNQVESFIKLLSPFVPFVAEELFAVLAGGKASKSDHLEKKSVHLQSWPAYDASLAREEVLEIAVQVNGKVRGTILVSADIASDTSKESELLEMARENEAIDKHLSGKKELKAIFIPGKIINFVVR